MAAAPLSLSVSSSSSWSQLLDASSLLPSVPSPSSSSSSLHSTTPSAFQPVNVHSSNTASLLARYSLGQNTYTTATQTTPLIHPLPRRLSNATTSTTPSSLPTTTTTTTGTSTANTTLSPTHHLNAAAHILHPLQVASVLYPYSIPAVNGGSSAVVSSGSVSSLPVSMVDPVSSPTGKKSSVSTKRRLARKAELARVSRKKKKHYVASLEQQVATLSEENAQLRQKLRHYQRERRRQRERSREDLHQQRNNSNSTSPVSATKRVKPLSFQQQESDAMHSSTSEHSLESDSSLSPASEPLSVTSASTSSLSSLASLTSPSGHDYTKTHNNEL